MKVLYIDCGMGAAGDMLTAALLDLLPEEERNAFIEEFNGLGIPGVSVSADKSEKCGITGLHVSVKVNGVEEDEHMHDRNHTHSHEHTHDHTHSHNGLHDIEHIVCEHLDLSEKVRADVMSVYGIIAEAESRVHGEPVSDIHFHEVGTWDAVADVTAVCMLMDRIAPGKVTVSPVNTGSGTVKCAHGILPVPAPATANILTGMPVFSNGIQSELCTPTGAALLKYFATDFGDMPAMTVSATGYGMGKKDFEIANCVRVIMGEVN